MLCNVTNKQTHVCTNRKVYICTINIREHYVNIYMWSQSPNLITLISLFFRNNPNILQIFHNFFLWLQKQVENYFDGLLLNVLNIASKTKQNAICKNLDTEGIRMRTE